MSEIPSQKLRIILHIFISPPILVLLYSLLKQVDLALNYSPLKTQTNETHITIPYYPNL